MGFGFGFSNTGFNLGFQTFGSYQVLGLGYIGFWVSNSLKPLGSKAFPLWVLGFGFWVHMGFWVTGLPWVFQTLGFWVLGPWVYGFWVLGFGSMGFGFWVYKTFGFWVLGYWVWVWVLGLKPLQTLQNLGFWVLGFWVIGFGYLWVIWVFKHYMGFGF